jgi:predicted murein hydrolase (TIGR00659 family)
LNWSDVVHEPLFGVALTVLVYVLSLGIHAKRRWIHPLFLTSVIMIVIVEAGRIPYEAYKAGGDVLSFFLGPATIALGVPLFKHARRLKRQFGAIVAGVTLGAVSGIMSAGLLVWALGGSSEAILSILPKSVTSPIAIELSRQLGGIPELSATLTVLTGLLGSMIGPEFLRLCGVRGDIPLAAAVGASSHGIGTARLVRESELQGGVSGLAMGLSGIIVSVLILPLFTLMHWWFKW